MLESKSKNTAKVLSSNTEQNKIKGSKNGQICNKGKIVNSAPPMKVKTLDDFFNPKSSRVLSGDFQVGMNSNSEGLNSLNFGGEGEKEGEKGGGRGGEDSSEDVQSSIMQSVFRHIMR